MKSHQSAMWLIAILYGWLLPLLVLADSADLQVKQLEQIKGEITQLTQAIDIDRRTREALLKNLPALKNRLVFSLSPCMNCKQR